MVGRRKAIKTLATAAALVSSLGPPAYPQGFANRKRVNHGGPLIDKKPEVDEKAYKAAFDRIPAPTRKYDPWGIARPPESATTRERSNDWRRMNSVALAA
jgi:hypothetical protein